MAWYSFVNQSYLYVSWRAHVAIAVFVCLLAQRPREYVNGFVALCIFKGMELFLRVVHDTLLGGTASVNGTVTLAWGVLSAHRMLPWSCAADARNSILWYEGNIGAGKTTTVAHYEKCKGSVVARERVPSELLDAFQKAPETVSMLLQMVLHTMRTNAFASAVALLRVRRQNSDAIAPQRYVYDRGLVGCLAFALWNYVVGSLTEEQIKVYLATSNNQPLQSVLDTLGDVPLDIVLMPTSIGECATRLRSRESVDSTTKQSYLAGVSMLHATVLISLCDLTRTSDKSVVRVLFGDAQQDLRAETSAISVLCACAVVRRTRTQTFATAQFPVACELDDKQWARYVWVCRAAHITALDRGVLAHEYIWMTALATAMRTPPAQQNAINYS